MLHPLPKMQVVVVLAGIVEEAGILAEGALHHLFKALAFPFRAFDQVVAVVDIGKVVLVVMELERLLGHVGAERIMSVGQFGEREGHGVPLF